jgi:O-antigen/teichoic acid export membrane protein
MYVRGSCLAAGLALPVAVAGFVFAKPLLLSWIGPEALPAVEAARLFLAYEALMSVQNVASTMVFGIGRIRVPLLINVVATLANLGLSIALVHAIGFDGAIVGTLIANGLAWPVLLAYYLNVFETALGVWLRRTLLPNLVALGVQLLFSVPLLLLVRDTRSLLVAIGACMLSLAVSLLAFVFVGVRGEDRRSLLGTLAHALGKAPREVPA